MVNYDAPIQKVVRVAHRANQSSASKIVIVIVGLIIPKDWDKRTSVKAERIIALIHELVIKNSRQLPAGDLNLYRLHIGNSIENLFQVIVSPSIVKELISSSRI